MTISRRAFLTRLALTSILAPLLTPPAFAETTQYTYDALGRLTGVTFANGSTVTYAYDDAGNRTQVVRPGVPAPGGSLVAAPTPIGVGKSSTLTWSTTNATSVVIDNGVGTVTPAAGGSISVSPSVTTTYTATITGPAGFITRQATVTVIPGSFSPTIAITGTGPVNLRTLANSAGYNGAQNANITFTVASGVTLTGAVGAANGGDGGFAVDSGTWPTSAFAVTLTLQNAGTLRAGGGGGGRGGNESSNGSGGGDGGDAIYCRLPMSITNTGTIRGGGGGGGGGASQTTGGGQIFRGGGGGGGGVPNGAGGTGGVAEDFNGLNGSAGTTSGGGAGGAGSGAHGGTGGGYAVAGGAGQASPLGDPIYAGGAGGAAGYAIRKNGNTVSVTNSGTITGTVA